MTDSQRDFSTRPRRSRVDVIGVGLVLLGFGLLIGVGWSERGARDAKLRATAELGRARQEVRDLEGAVAKAGAGGLGERVARAALVGRFPPRRFVREMTSLLPDGLRVDSVTATYGKSLMLQLAFRARDAAAYDAFLERLRSSRLCAIRAASGERRSGEMAGTVTLEWRDDGGAAR